MHPHSTALAALAQRWAQVPAREIATFQTYVTELLAALELPLPHPGSGYEFEHPLKAIDRASGKAASQRIDLYRRGHFVMEAKHTDTARSNELVLRAAYQQAKSYAYELTDDVPPFIMVMDVARTLMVWRLRGARYEDYTIPLRRIDLTRLAENAADVEFLRTAWLAPDSLRADHATAAVTREVADRLAQLSASLEGRGLGQERVARFLIRCVFTMFAEDVGLLPEKPFTAATKRFSEPDRSSWLDDRIPPPPPAKPVPKTRRNSPPYCSASGMPWTWESLTDRGSCSASTGTSSVMQKRSRSRIRTLQY